jgi:hypothetical protein
VRKKLNREITVRKIINGKAYDTDTATLVASGDHGHELSQAWWSLYRTPAGAWFEVAADHDGIVEGFQPLTDAEARRWLEQQENPIVEQYFGEAPEASSADHEALRCSRRTEEWITAADALQLLKPVLGGESSAKTTICKRAHSGLIRARAEQFMVGEQVARDVEIESRFWWAEGGSSLTQNWDTGDFDTWVDRGETHLRALGVSFLRADIEKAIPVSKLEPTAPPAPPAAKPGAGGRPRADWWEDLLIEMCFQYFCGNLQPKTQADISARHAAVDHRPWLRCRGKHGQTTSQEALATNRARSEGRKLGFRPLSPLFG